MGDGRGWMCVKVQALETCRPQKSTGHKGAGSARGGEGSWFGLGRHPHSPPDSLKTPLPPPSLMTSTVSYGHGKQIIAKLHFPRLLPTAFCDLHWSLHWATKSLGYIQYIYNISKLSNFEWVLVRKKDLF